MNGRLPTLHDYQEQLALPASVITRAEEIMKNAAEIQSPKAILCAASVLHALETLGYDAPTISDVCGLSSIPTKRVRQVKDELKTNKYELR